MRDEAQPSIEPVRRTPVLLCCALLLCAAAPARAASPTVRGTLTELRDTGAITAAQYDRHIASWNAAQRTLRHLHGARFRELHGVVATLDDLAARRLLQPSRLPLLFTTLDVNRRWWPRGPLLGYGRRVTFAGSDLVWQAYPGSGLQIQWLATFGRANGLFTGGQDRYDARLGALLDEAAGLATQRAGGIAWEYAFPFDGGRPPWVSGLAQGTALQAYARAAIRLHQPEFFGIGRAALGIFHTPPPEGVAVAAPAGTHYLISSSLPKVRVLNAVVQALNGLHDFAALANDADARALFAAGETELRAELPRYDTGAWSMYSTTRESDLGYHLLVRDFLRGLCARLRKDGGTPDPTPYCTTADRFTTYLRQPPRVVLQASPRPRLRRRATIRFTVSKVSFVTLTVRRRGAVVVQETARVGRGRHRLAWGPPRHTGAVSVSLRATDLAGNSAAVSGAVRVAR